MPCVTTSHWHPLKWWQRLWYFPIYSCSRRFRQECRKLNNLMVKWYGLEAFCISTDRWNDWICIRIVQDYLLPIKIHMQKRFIRWSRGSLVSPGGNRIGLKDKYTHIICNTSWGHCCWTYVYIYFVYKILLSGSLRIDKFIYGSAWYSCL